MASNNEEENGSSVPKDGGTENKKPVSPGGANEVVNSVGEVKNDLLKTSDVSQTAQDKPRTSGENYENIEEKVKEEVDASSPDPIKSCIATPAATGADDESKKDGDTSKAVTFAEDIEVYDLKANTPITVSLDTPVHLIEQEPDGEWKIAGAVPGDLTDAAHNKDQDGYSSVGFLPPSSEEKREEVLLEEKLPAARPCVLNLSTDTPAILKDVNSVAVSGNEVTSKELQSSLKEEGVDLDQKFIVSAVDESELNIESAYSEENGQIPNLGLKLDGSAGVDPTFSREHINSGQSSHSWDSMQHDTIGPLENQAFLKTLQYSVSHDEDQFVLQSNYDISSLNVGQNDPNLDGGWAWVVLVAAFVNMIVLSASCLLAGVMMTSYVEVTKTDLTGASWIGSVYISVMCLTGPVVGSVTQKIGARPTICLAGFVMLFGFTGASFSVTVPQLILTHSIVAGIGAGLAINPSFVIVGQYFNRLRGLACGLISSGGGAGVLAGGTLISQLLRTYDLSGAYLIWAAVCFNVTAMGMLMRPSPEEKLRLAEKSLMIEQPSQHDLASGHNSIMSGINSMYSGTDLNSVYSGMDKLSQGRRSSGLHRHHSKHSNGDVDVPLLKAIFHKEMSRSSHSMSTNRSYQHRSSNQITSSSMQRVHSPYGSNNLGPNSPVESPTLTSLLTVQNGRNALSNHNITSTNSLAASHLLSTSTLAAQTSSNHALPASPTSTRATTRSSFHRPRLLSSISQPNSHYTSLSLISQRLSFKDGMGNHRDLDNESMTSTLVNTLRPSDTLTPRYALGSMSISAVVGSMASFPTSLAIINDDLSRMDGIVPSRRKEKTIKHYMIDILDALRIIFNNRPYVVFLGTCFLWALGEAPIMIYLSSYAISRGTDPMKASALYTALGVGSIAGRFLTGLIATDKSIGPMLLHIGCLGLAGILVCLSPLFTSTVMEQMLFSSLLGVYTGSLVPLMSLMTIELLGISELSVGFGFLYMSQGFGYLIGPPLSGVLVDRIGFVYSFVFSGVTLILGSLLGLVIPLLIDVDEDDNNLDELEKVLEKIDDSDSESDNQEDGDGGDESDKEDEEKNQIDLDGMSVSVSGVENHSSLSEDTIINMPHSYEDWEDKLETIKEVV